MRVLIPSCLKLDEKQVAALEKWFEQFEDDEEEALDCCGSGHTFHVTGSGIGDDIVVCHGKRRFNVGYDDNGEILGEPCHKGDKLGHSWENPPGFHVNRAPGLICTYCGEPG